MTAKQRVKNRINEVGYIDNYWCIDNKITTRLGAVILTLRKQGMIFDGKYGKDLGKPRELHKNFYYTHLNPIPKQTIAVLGRNNETLKLL